jgi:hypothetical protein
VLIIFYFYIIIYIVINRTPWYESLLSSSINYRLFTRINNSHLIMDTGTFVTSLDKHSQFLDITTDSNAILTWTRKKLGYQFYLDSLFFLLTLKNLFSSFLLVFLMNKKLYFHGLILEKLKMIFSNIVALEWE